jgi:ribosomal RNA-processing protein 9
MSSFFTLPASQKKRKRPDTDPGSVVKKRATHAGTSSGGQTKQPKRPRRDESISSGSEEGDIPRKPVTDDIETSGSSSESDRDDETGAERRLRLAERYLENIKSEVQQTGFDAEEIDRDLIAERLKEDVAESKGRLYRHIASSFDLSQSTKTHFRADTQSTTSIAVSPPYIYTVSKDITLIKWELPTPTTSTTSSKSPSKKPPPARRRPIKLLSSKGYPHHKGSSSYQHHTAPILTIACSPSGEYLATGSSDHKLIIWSTTTLTPLRVFNQHRDAVTSLAFRLHTNQLFSASKDRTIKTWSLNEMAYVETLFGHQDEVLDVCAGGQERCISVGGRDRTARLWKVVEESQLVFRGGGGGGGSSKRERHTGATPRAETKFSEGSIDRVAFISDDTFITGSDNGSLSLWNIHKKKPISTVTLAHGLDPPPKPEDSFAETDMVKWGQDKVPIGPQPRWITALKTIPFSDLVISGSWDGWVRVWRVSADEKKLEAVGRVGRAEGSQVVNGMGEGDYDIKEGDEAEGQCIKGIINDLAVFERGDRGQDGLCIVAAVGKEHRLGRWKKVQGKNGAVVFEIPKISKTIES